MNVLQIVLGCSGKALKLMDQKPIYAVQAAGVKRGKNAQEELYHMRVQKEQLEKLRNETWKRGNKEQLTEKIEELQEKIEEKEEKHQEKESEGSKGKKKKRKDRKRRKNKRFRNRSRRNDNDNDNDSRESF